MKKQPINNIVCPPVMKSVTDAFLHPPQGVTHFHEWLYAVSDRLGIRYCQCGKSYALLIVQQNPDDNELLFKWVEIQES